MRCFAISARCQHRHAIRTLIRDCLFAPLRAHGVERLVADIAPTNAAMCRLFLELGFVPSGQLLTDRWGPVVRFTLHFHQPAAAAFQDRFGAGAPPRRAEKGAP